MSPRTAILSPNRDAYSETFIRAHIEHLPDVALVLTDGFLPRRRQDGSLLLPTDTLARLLRRVKGATVEGALRQALAHALRKAGAEVVLAEYGPTGMAALDTCKALGIPLVVHFHGVDAFHCKLLEEHGNYARLAREAAAVVVVSREMETHLLELGFPRERLHYNVYGVDVERFTPAAPDQAPPHFFGVGRFSDKKAPHLTLLAFARALEREPTMRLTIAGRGDLLEACRQLAGALGITHAVELPGVLAPEQVSEAMQRSRAFVQHSVITSDGDREGTPLAVLEAMSCGLPVIATRHAGIADVVAEDVNGLLGDERDLDAMAGHLVRLARDPAAAAAMGRAGRERALRDHDVRDRVGRLAAILERAVSERTRG